MLDTLQCAKLFTNSIPCTQRIRPNFPTPNPPLLIKPTQPINKLFLPLLPRLDTLKHRSSNHTHRPSCLRHPLTPSLRVNNKLLHGGKRLLIGMKLKCLSQQLEILHTFFTADERFSEERETGVGPCGSVFVDCGVGGEEFGEGFFGG